MAKADGVARIIALAALGKNGGGSTGGTTNYLDLINKPKINNVELTGNKTLEDLGINIPELSNLVDGKARGSVRSAYAVDYGKNLLGEYAQAFGYQTIASGYCSHAEGADSIASGHYSHAEGANTTASGEKSHAEGIGAKASGNGSHAEGNSATASGKCAHAEGYATVAQGDYQHVQGKWNIADTTSAYIIGNGFIATNNKSNAHTIDWSGNAWFAGDVYTGSTSGTNKDEGSKKLATEDIVNEALSKKQNILTAGENITISEDNVISANVSGGTDANAVYTYYASYSDDNWFTEEAVAAILQAVKDNGYSNFELCTLNGSHYTLTKGGNLQALTATDETFELLSPQNNLEKHTNYTFNAHLNENNRVVVSGLVKTVHTAEEMFGTYLPRTLEKMPGYDGTREHLILQANAGNLEWDSSLDGGIFGDSYTDPAYYTEKQVDRIVTDTVNEALGGKY